MDRTFERRLRFYLRLSYPVQIVAAEAVFRGWLPDLPGCQTECDDVQGLYVKLDVLRVAYLTRACTGGEEPPLPNTYLDSDGTAAA